MLNNIVDNDYEQCGQHNIVIPDCKLIKVQQYCSIFLESLHGEEILYLTL